MDEPSDPELFPPPPIPDWVPPARECKPYTRSQVLEMVLEAIACIKGVKPNALRAKSSAGPVIGLWKGLGRPAPEVFLADLDLVARACRESPQGLFRNDVQGVRIDGTRWRPDDSRHTAMVCRRSPPANSGGATWDDRLEAARAWEKLGFPTSPAPGQGAAPPKKGSDRGAYKPDGLPVISSRGTEADVAAF